MPFRVTCSACKRVLHVADNLPDQVFTCPRCLAGLSASHGQVRPGAPGRFADAEVTHDTNWTGIGLILLAILGGIGIF